MLKKAKADLFFIITLKLLSTKFYSVIQIFIKKISKNKTSTLVETLNTLNGVTSHDDIIEMKLKSG